MNTKTRQYKEHLGKVKQLVCPGCKSTGPFYDCGGEVLAGTEHRPMVDAHGNAVAAPSPVIVRRYKCSHEKCGVSFTANLPAPVGTDGPDAEHEE